MKKNKILEENHNLIEAYRNPQSLFYTYGFRDAVGAAIMILQGKTVETLEIEKTLAIIEQDIQFIEENSTQDQVLPDQVLPAYFNGYDCEAFAKAGHKFFDLEFSYYKGASTIPEYGKTENINPKADQSTTGYSFHCWNTLTQPIIGGGELTAETCAGQGGPFTVVFCIRPIGCTENITTNEDIRTLNEAGRKSIEYQQVLAEKKLISLMSKSVLQKNFVVMYAWQRYFPKPLCRTVSDIFSIR